jgi:hypothetical protein
MFQASSGNASDERTPGSQLQRMLTLIHFLDMLVERKAVAVMSSTSHVKGLETHLKNILFSLTEMYRRFDGKTHSFRAVLFVNSPLLEYLDPVVNVSSSNSTYITLADTGLIQRNLSKNSDSIAMRAVQSGVPVSASGESIPRFHAEQATYQRSIMAYPLTFSKKLKLALATRSRQFPDSAGVLVIDTNDETCFSAENHNYNEVFMRPFVNRMMFEMAISSIQIKEKNHEAN